MVLQVKLFGQLAKSAGAVSLQVSLPDSATCKSLREHLAASAPSIASYLHLCTVAINHEYARDEAVLKPTDEVALIGLVCGG